MLSLEGYLARWIYINGGDVDMLPVYSVGVSLSNIGYRYPRAGSCLARDRSVVQGEVMFVLWVH